MGKIVTLGEVVADVYREPSSSHVELPFTARPGGAPANVAVAAARLGAEAAFVGRLGDDLFGDFILEALDSVGVDTSAVRRQSPPTRTTLAFVEVAEDGDRTFTFYRSVPAADELLVPEDIRRESLEGASFANFGSIPLIKDPVRSATYRFAELANELGVDVAFDVNLRENLWEDIDTFRRPWSRCSTSRRCVKLSEEELGPVLGTDDDDAAADLLLRPRRHAAAGQQGRRGRVLRDLSFRGTCRSFPIDEVVDATGAGDAFLASTLAHLSDIPSWAGDEAASPRRSGAGRRAARSPAPRSARCRRSPRGRSSRASWPPAPDRTGYTPSTSRQKASTAQRWTRSDVDFSMVRK